MEIALACFPQPGPVKLLPYPVSVGICLAVGYVDWLLAGHVPRPNHPVWNFTLHSLGYMVIDGTFGTEGPVKDIKKRVDEEGAKKGQ